MLLAGHAAVDEFVVLDRHWRRSPRRLALMYRRVREVRPAVTLDPQSLTKSALVAWCSGAPHRVGFARPWGRELAPNLNNQLVAATHEHLVDRSQELLAPLGLQPQAIRFDLPTHEVADQSACEILRRFHLNGRYYAMNPGASWPSKRWATAEYGRLARRLGQRLQITALITWAGEAERMMAEEVVERAGGHAVMAPATNLPQLLALLRRATFFVGSDTGPLHIAAACGTACVALFGPTRSSASGPCGPGHIVIQGPDSRPMRRGRRRHDETAMRSISCDAVFAACEQVYSRACATSGRSQQSYPTLAAS
jgi:ADP-heptose:LPS heptosyltransferase